LNRFIESVLSILYCFISIIFFGLCISFCSNRIIEFILGVARRSIVGSCRCLSFVVGCLCGL